MDGWMDGWTDGQMDGRRDGKSPYSTGLCPLSAQFQPKNYIKRGKGTADHMMPLDDWFLAHPHIALFIKCLYIKPIKTRPYTQKHQSRSVE